MGPGLMDAILATIKGVGDRSEKRLAALEARLAAIEARGPGLKYCGVFEPGALYQVGDCVTHQGSLWIAREGMVAGDRPPGEGATGWQLAVKRGRDARDAR